MAAAEEKTNDELTILNLDPTLGNRLIELLVSKSIIKKGKKDEALDIINGLDVKRTNKVPKQLNANKPNRDSALIKKLVPFTGICIQGKCQALNNNHGLFNQCDKMPQNNSKFCKACQSPNGMSGLTKIQSCGTVQDRILQYNDTGNINRYKTPDNEVQKKNGDMEIKKGFWSKGLGKVLEEINKKRETPILREQIEQVAQEIDVVIPEECWEVTVSNKGPKAGSKKKSKNSTPVTSDDEPEPTSPPEPPSQPASEPASEPEPTNQNNTNVFDNPPVVSDSEDDDDDDSDDDSDEDDN